MFGLLPNAPDAMFVSHKLAFARSPFRPPAVFPGGLLALVPSPSPTLGRGAPTSSDTFSTPSVVDDGFYTCSPASSLLQLLFSLPRTPIRATAHRLSSSRSTSSSLAAAIAGIGDTINLIVAYHRLTVRSLLLSSQQQLDRFSSVQIPLCIVSTPQKKGPQHCDPEVREEREAHLHDNGFLIFSFSAANPPYSNNCSRNRSPRRPQLLPSP
ncbi:hypothetical protein BHE74_00017728 [Ensete ventricosum]|nr:hypothetical protein BHE74_00017728 [Ensete ventricosum]